MESVERVKALIAYHVFFVAGDSVASVKRTLDSLVFTLGDVDSNGV
jgi:hypothetical protein